MNKLRCKHTDRIEKELGRRFSIEYKVRRPAENVDFDKTLALLPLKMLLFLPNKDFSPLPH